MLLWRNWHTRTFDGRVRQLVRVQVPLAASGGAKLNCDGSGFAPFCASNGAKQNKNGSCFALFFVPDNDNPKTFPIEEGFGFLICLSC